ncbi:unnamed protein product [Bursaphelenchus xylophilus]|uniref:(pine wood nematode) hypothetical protein n=1 Tax=Bursaphelenchus xylophilus TaxID=6326 RepID=A0A7I8WXX9_BURXY|nr:unnamed protein product [Bursaphelenchus xylophilus]CAG9100732.1 unnamed protein product [Bursaphelenchus xylophilus]
MSRHIRKNLLEKRIYLLIDDQEDERGIKALMSFPFLPGESGAFNYLEFSQGLDQFRKMLTENQYDEAIVTVLSSVASMTPTRSGEIGRSLKEVVRLANKFRLLLFPTLINSISVKRTPLLRELAPVIDAIHCEHRDTSHLEGRTIAHVTLSEQSENISGYATPIFELKTKSLAGLFLEQFFMSNFPRQPELMELACKARFGFEMPPEFYKNVFDEIAGSLPNLVFLQLDVFEDCRVRTMRDGGDIISHLLKINEYAHVPVEIHMKIMTDAKTWLAMCNTMAHIFDFKSDQSADGEAMFHAERMKLKCTFLDSADA